MKLSTTASIGFSSLVVIGSVFALQTALSRNSGTESCIPLVEGENTVVASKPTSFLIIREDEPLFDQPLLLSNTRESLFRMDFVLKPSMNGTAKPFSLGVLRTPEVGYLVQRRYTVFAVFFLNKDQVANFKIENRPPFFGKNRRLLLVQLGNSLPYPGMHVLQTTRPIARGQTFQDNDCKDVHIYPHFLPRSNDLPLPLLPGVHSVNGLKANKDIGKGENVNSSSIALPSTEEELVEFLLRSKQEFDSTILNGKNTSDNGP